MFREAAADRRRWCFHSDSTRAVEHAQGRAAAAPHNTIAVYLRGTLGLQPHVVQDANLYWGLRQLRGLPRVAELESKHATGNAWNRPIKALEEVRRAMLKAYRNGALEVAQVEFQEEQVAKYMARSFSNVEEDRKAIVEQPAVTVFADPTAELQQMETLSQDVRLRGENTLDFYILSAVVADRSAPGHVDRPAVFFSTDKAQFEREAPVFVDQRIVWRPDFQLVAALKDWHQSFDAAD